MNRIALILGPLMAVSFSSAYADDYRLRVEMDIDTGGVENWAPTGQKIIFTSAGADLETILEAWYVHICALSGASDCAAESGVEAWALEKIREGRPPRQRP